jgi:hypothetical protein
MNILTLRDSIYTKNRVLVRVVGGPDRTRIHSFRPALRLRAAKNAQGHASTAPGVGCPGERLPQKSQLTAVTIEIT